MATKQFLVLGTIFLIAIIGKETTSAQYWNQQFGSRRFYPQYNYPNYQQSSYPQRSGFQQQQTDSFQLPPGVSVSNAEWVCKNPKSGDMMVIASETGPNINRFSAPQEWVQVYPQQPQKNQPNDAQPQQPLQLPSINPNNPFLNPKPQQPINSQTQTPPVTSTTTTTTPSPKPPGLVNTGDVQPSFPTSTTPKPADILWPSGGNSSNKPGFTLTNEKPSPPTPSLNTTKAPTDDDDDGPLEIVMG